MRKKKKSIPIPYLGKQHTASAYLLAHTVLPAAVVAGVVFVDAIVDIIPVVVTAAHDVTAAARVVEIMLVAAGGQLSRTPGRPLRTS